MHSEKGYPKLELLSWTTTTQWISKALTRIDIDDSDIFKFGFTLLKWIL